MTRFALKNPVSVLVLAALLLVAGIASYMSLPRESFPEIKVPYIFVTTVYPGASPEDMERLVAQKIEDQLEGLDGMKKFTSQSYESVSMVSVEFTPDVAVETALRRVKDKVDAAKPDLPPDAEDPSVIELNFANFPIFNVSLSANYEMEKLETIAEDLKDRIKGVHGVLDAKLMGKQEREIAIEVLPARLREYDLGLFDIQQAIQSQHRNIPGGILQAAGNRFSLQVTGELRTPQEFEHIIVRSEGGQVVRLSDVATVKFAYKPDRSTIARMGGKPSLTIAVTKRTGANLIETVHEIKRLVAEIEPTWPKGTDAKFSGDQSIEIEHMVNELQNHIIMGLILVVGVLTFFLGFRNSLFISTAIPFSMALGAIVLLNLGTTLNMIVLFSLVIALGMLVDDGIVVVENIYRHLHMGKTRFQAALDGTREVMIPVTTATLTTIAAFLPLLWIPGIMGDFMKYLPITVSVTLTGSLFVAFVFNPVFASLFLTKQAEHVEGEEEGGVLFKKLQNAYTGTLNLMMDHPILLGVINLAFLVSGIAAYAMLGKGAIFFPDIEPQVVSAEIEGPLGLGLGVTDSAIRAPERVILSLPDSLASISSVSTIIGSGKSASFSGGANESHKAYVDINFDQFEEREVSSWKTLKWLQDSLPAKLPGWKLTVKKQEDGPPQGHPVSFEISGEDYGVIAAYADSVRRRLQGVDGLVNISSDYDPARPEIRVDVDRLQAMRLGVATSQVAMAVRGSVHGLEAGKFRQAGDEHDIMVRLAGPVRDNLAVFDQIVVPGREGAVIPLTSVASLRQTASIASIKHLDGNRTVEVFAEIAPGIRDQEAVKRLARTAIEPLKAPPGYKIAPGSSNRDQEETQAFLGKALLIAMALVFLTMVFQFNSVWQPFLVVAGIVFSIGGVFWGLLAVGVTFSIFLTGIGIIALAGVVAKNGIVLIDFINHLRHEGVPLREAVIVGGRTRLRPVMLTAITAMIGLIPMATGKGFDFMHMALVTKSASTMWWAPMAWALFWGLFFNTALTLVGVPIFYYNYEKMRLRLAAKLFRKEPVNGTHHVAVGEAAQS